MNIARRARPTLSSAKACVRVATALALVSVVAPLHLAAQAINTPAAPAPMFLATAALPDAPGMEPESSSSATNLDLPAAPQSTASYTSGTPAQPMASHTDKYIAPGQPVPAIGVKDKFALGFKDAFSPLSFIGWAASAGYEQALNGSPNYGTNSVAFGKRFGASVARATSEGVFSDSVMGSILREDPRYYRMGPGHNVGKRALYAVTRTLITRTDSGKTTPNLALLSGNLGGAYLTKAYYPDLNTSNSEVLKTFAGSVGGSALGFAVSEFLSGALNIFHGSKPVKD